VARAVDREGKPKWQRSGYKYHMAPQLLPDKAIDQALTTLHWQREGDELVKTVTRKDFAAALAYVNEVGALAEARNHHPDISISWNKVSLRLSTHSAGGLTQADVDLAQAVDQIDS
jgi:4a-hydroxytetrahydrobiopterin dehydratase